MALFTKPNPKAVNMNHKTVQRPNFYVINVGKTYYKEKVIFYLQGLLARTIQNEHKMMENLKPRNLKLGSYCV